MRARLYVGVCENVWIAGLTMGRITKGWNSYIIDCQQDLNVKIHPWQSLILRQWKNQVESSILNKPSGDIALYVEANYESYTFICVGAGSVLKITAEKKKKKKSASPLSGRFPVASLEMLSARVTRTLALTPTRGFARFTVTRSRLNQPL